MNDEAVIEFSDERDKISEALFLMQSNLGEAKKSATNPHFKSKYADLAAVAEAVDPALEIAKLTRLQGVAGNEDGSTVTVETMLLHVSGQYVRSRLTLKPSKADPQGAGSAITYARRYGLQSLTGIVPEDDDGERASRPGKAQRAAGASFAEEPTFKHPPAQTEPAEDEPQKIPIDVRARFMEFTTKLPAPETEAIIKSVQEHFGHTPTGRVPDLFEGDEARDAYKRLKKAAEELTK